MILPVSETLTEIFMVTQPASLPADSGSFGISSGNVPAPNYKVKIRFHYEKQSPPIEKEIFFTPGKEINYIIKQNKEGNFVLRFYSEVPRLGFEDTLLNHRILDYTKTPMKERKYNIQSDTNRKK